MIFDHSVFWAHTSESISRSIICVCNRIKHPIIAVININWGLGRRGGCGCSGSGSGGWVAVAAITVTVVAITIAVTAVSVGT